jgi:predicted lipoprotein
LPTIAKRLIGVSSGAALIALMVWDTTFVSDSDLSLRDEVAQKELGSRAFADEYYDSQIVPFVEENAVDLEILHEAILVDADSAGEEYGNRDGDSAAYSVPVTFSAQAIEYENDLILLEVEGVEPEGSIYLAAGPALNGTAMRDVSGLIEFDMFTNQLDYQDVSTKLNDKVRDLVLSEFDPITSLEGKQLEITGAMSLFSTRNYIVTPVSIEVID